MSICVMADIDGLALTAADEIFLLQPEIAGIILFARNYKNPEQLKVLCQQVKILRPDLIIAVDQEGGRVQRFREGFLGLPAMATLGSAYDVDQPLALAQSYSLGWLMAAELIQHGIDISFAPVLDLDYQQSSVIGDRAFAGSSNAVLALADAFIDGMASAGMSATAKHFPGHGFVSADSHLELPTDSRSFETLDAHDLVPFKSLINDKKLAAIMPAHVIYSAIDDQHTAGFSAYWLQDILRKRLGFEGLIYSDDLSMEGAAASGRPSVRAQKAQQAGCNVLLICNNRDAAQEIVDTVRTQSWTLLSLASMQAPASNTNNIYASDDWQKHIDVCESILK